MGCSGSITETGTRRSNSLYLSAQERRRRRKEQLRQQSALPSLPRASEESPTTGDTQRLSPPQTPATITKRAYAAVTRSAVENFLHPNPERNFEIVDLSAQEDSNEQLITERMLEQEEDERSSQGRLSPEPSATASYRNGVVTRWKAKVACLSHEEDGAELRRLLLPCPARLVKKCETWTDSCSSSCGGDDWDLPSPSSASLRGSPKGSCDEWRTDTFERQRPSDTTLNTSTVGLSVIDESSSTLPGCVAGNSV